MKRSYDDDEYHFVETEGDSKRRQFQKIYTEAHINTVQIMMASAARLAREVPPVEEPVDEAPEVEDAYTQRPYWPQITRVK
ncbi:hypothetical protein DICA0_B10836 [Diutina catenulata]